VLTAYFPVRGVLFGATPDHKIVFLKIRFLQENLCDQLEKNSKIPLELNNGKVRGKTYETSIYRTSPFSQKCS
jgi:hypothetical protein